MSILKAKIEDASECIEILMPAMDDIAYAISGNNDIIKTKDILIDFFKHSGNRLSFENVFVKKIDNKIAGAILIYDIKNSENLDKAINDRLARMDKMPLEKECFGDGIYIDSLGVKKEFQKQGIAKELLEFTFNYAFENRIQNLFLLVDIKKEFVFKFYEKMGFKIEKNIEIYNEKFLYMKKEIY